MIKLLFLVLLSLVAILVGVLIDASQGSVIFTLEEWNIEVDIVLFVLALLLVFVIFYMLLRMVAILISAPKRLKAWQHTKRHKQSEEAHHKGLVYMIEGRWQLAERSFEQATKHSQEPYYIDYLYAAQAAHKLGDIEKRDQHLAKAHKHQPDNLAIGITQAEIQLDQKQADLALETLSQLQKKSPKQKQIKQLLLTTHIELKEWSEVLAILPKIEKMRLLSPEEIDAQYLQAYVGKIAESSYDESQMVWQQIPKKYKKHPYIIEAYVKQQLTGDATHCEPLLYKTLKQQWDHNLVELYGLVTATNSSQHLHKAESFLSYYSEDPVLLLTLGRLSMKQHLWGKAKRYFNESLAIKETAEVCHELAKLSEHDGNQAKAADFYARGLALAIQKY